MELSAYFCALRSLSAEITLGTELSNASISSPSPTLSSAWARRSLDLQNISQNFVEKNRVMEAGLLFQIQILPLFSLWKALDKDNLLRERKSKSYRRSEIGD